MGYKHVGVSSLDLGLKGFQILGSRVVKNEF